MRDKRLSKHGNSQSPKPVKIKFEEAKKHVFKEYAKLFQNLSDCNNKRSL